MARLVAKFGGTSVADLDRIRAAAGKIHREVEAGHRVAVVVSAMAGVTDDLVAKVDAMGRLVDAREYDAVVAAGEQVTAGLMALALQQLGVPARSWLGWQVPVHTDDCHGRATLLEIESAELGRRLDRGEVVVLAGFQGVARTDCRITTLGRGGSDTSAVALAAALAAERCDIYTDVDGVYTTDPRIVPRARRLARVTFEEMLEMASLGAKVLQTRAVALAFRERVRLQVLSSFAGAVGSELPGTLVVDEEEIVERNIVSGITYSRDEAKVTLPRLPDRPGVAASIFAPLAEAGINVDMIVQDISEDGYTAMTFTVSRRDRDHAQTVLRQACPDLEGPIATDSDVVKVSVIGVGMRSNAGVAERMFATLAEKGINIQVIATSEVKISVLVAEEYAELAVRALHSAYGLDAGEEAPAAG